VDLDDFLDRNVALLLASPDPAIQALFDPVQTPSLIPFFTHLEDMNVLSISTFIDQVHADQQRTGTPVQAIVFVGLVMDMSGLASSKYFLDQPTRTIFNRLNSRTLNSIVTYAQEIQRDLNNPLLNSRQIELRNVFLYKIRLPFLLDYEKVETMQQIARNRAEIQGYTFLNPDEILIEIASSVYMSPPPSLTAVQDLPDVMSIYDLWTVLDVGPDLQRDDLETPIPLFTGVTTMAIKPAPTRKRKLVHAYPSKNVKIPLSTSKKMKQVVTGTMH
jgi:hypothetical protein